MVENADVRLHIVRIELTNPENIVMGELNALKYNMEEPHSLGSVQIAIYNCWFE